MNGEERNFKKAVSGKRTLEIQRFISDDHQEFDLFISD